MLVQRLSQKCKDLPQNYSKIGPNYYSGFEPSHAFSLRFSVCTRPQLSDRMHTLSLSVAKQTHRESADRLKSQMNVMGATTNVHNAHATGGFWCGFTLRDFVDSIHSRRITTFRLKNRRTFTLFTKCCSTCGVCGTKAPLCYLATALYRTRAEAQCSH